jgi:adenine phosphoribosyltransferase
MATKKKTSKPKPPVKATKPAVKAAVKPPVKSAKATAKPARAAAKPAAKPAAKVAVKATTKSAKTPSPKIVLPKIRESDVGIRAEADRDEPPLSIAPRADLVFPAIRMRPIAPLTSPGDALAFARSKIRDIADYPKKGIAFKDITPLLASPRAFHIVLDSMAERFIGEHVDAVVGVEARGFIFGGALAARLNASFVPARKVGKLPYDRDRVTYDTEYSTSELEMHKDTLSEEARVVVVDDVLATGGTARAAAELVRRQGAYVVAYAFAVELSFLKGRERLLPVRVESVIVY